MEKFKFIDKNPEKELVSLDELVDNRSKFLEVAADQLKELLPALKKFIETAEALQPDVIVFLDKGSRLLGTPLMKVLRDRNNATEWNPQLDFLNDDNLKNNFMQPPVPISEYSAKKLSFYKDKRILFVDETISSGIGASALLHKTAETGIDAYYFALTTDDQEEIAKNRQITIDKLSLFQNVAAGEAAAFYDNMRNSFSERRFTGNVNIPILFTKEASSLYVYEEPTEGVTRLRYEKAAEDEINEAYNYIPWDDKFERVPSELGNNVFSTREKTPYGKHDPIRSNDHPPSAESWLDYDQTVRQINLQTVKILKQMIRKATELSLTQEKS